MPLQNLSDRAAGNLVSQIGQGTLDAPIAPIAILFSHPCHQGFDHTDSTRSPRFALATPIVFVSDQFSWRCQASRVSVVTMVANSTSSFRPKPFGLGAQSCRR